MFPRHTYILKVCTLFLFIYLIFFLTFLVYSPVIHAARNPIQVDSNSNTLRFPKAIDFKITLHDNEGSLTQATIYLMYKDSHYQTSHQVNSTSVASTYTFQWHEDLTVSNDYFPAVGTQMSYYWAFIDTIGNSYTTPWQTINIVDNRFNWQHTSKGLYQVNWYDRGTDFGQMILGKVDTDLQSISHNLDGNLHHQITLWIYKNPDDFQGSLPSNVHEWVGGIAFPAIFEASIVAQSSDDVTLQRDMPHELTHLVFHQLVAPTIAPTWFDEGLAVANQNFHESEMLVRFKTALNNHNLLPLSTLTQQFPADSDKAYLAYAQSWQLIDYLYQTFGSQKMSMLIKNMHNPNQGFDTDMRQALGLDVAHLENQWHISLNQSPTLSKDQLTEPLPVPTQPFNPYDRTTITLLFVGVTLIIVALFGLGCILTYQRRAKQKVLLAQQQARYSVSGQSISPHWSPQTLYTQPSNATPPSLYTPPKQQPYYPPKQAGPGGI